MDHFLQNLVQPKLFLLQVVYIVDHWIFHRFSITFRGFQIFDIHQREPKHIGLPRTSMDRSLDRYYYYIYGPTGNHFDKYENYNAIFRSRWKKRWQVTLHRFDPCFSANIRIIVYDASSIHNNLLIYEYFGCFYPRSRFAFNLATWQFCGRVRLAHRKTLPKYVQNNYFWWKLGQTLICLRHNSFNLSFCPRDDL